MKQDNDFGLLLHGLTPEESRHLHRLLRDWGRGDEASFPVQLALITRLQWKVAAQIPFGIDEQRKRLEQTLTQARELLGTTSQGLALTLETQVKALQAEVIQQSITLRESALSAGTHLAQADRVATQIQESLQEGRASWQKAQEEFQRERARLEEATVTLRSQLAAKDRGLAILAAFLLTALGTVCGFILARV